MVSVQNQRIPPPWRSPKARWWMPNLPNPTPSSRSWKPRELAPGGEHPGAGGCWPRC